MTGNKSKLRHGHTKKGGWRSPTYITWMSMRARCSKPDRYDGVEVCSSWQVFDNFLSDMGERPEGKTLDRIDNAKGYYKENCRWATAAEQARNRTNNRLDASAVRMIRFLIGEGFSKTEVGNLFGVHRMHVHRIVTGQAWKDA